MPMEAAGQPAQLAAGLRDQLQVGAFQGGYDPTGPFDCVYEGWVAGAPIAPLPSHSLQSNTRVAQHLGIAAFSAAW